MQVAFGTDFSKDQYVQSLAGDKGLIYLMSHCLEGLMKTLENPLLTVSACKVADINCELTFNMILIPVFKSIIYQQLRPEVG